MQKVFLFCFFITIILTSCQPNSDVLLSDFSIELAWNTGSLPPEYTYSYVITIGPELHGVFEYQFGYDDITSENSYSKSFQITQENLEMLYHHLQDMLREDWNLGETMEGGPGSSLNLMNINKLLFDL